MTRCLIQSYYKMNIISYFRSFLLGLFVLPFLSACLNKDLELEDDGTPSSTVVKLNKNVQGFLGVANACMNADSIVFFNIEHHGDGSALYWLRMKEGGDIELYSEIVSDEIPVPKLSMNRIGESFYWTVNGTILTDSNGNKLSVTDDSKPISFILRNGTILCRIKKTVIGEYPVTKAG